MSWQLSLGLALFLVGMAAQLFLRSKKWSKAGAIDAGTWSWIIGAVLLIGGIGLVVYRGLFPDTTALIGYAIFSIGMGFFLYWIDGRLDNKDKKEKAIMAAKGAAIILGLMAILYIIQIFFPILGTSDNKTVIP